MIKLRQGASIDSPSKPDVIMVGETRDFETAEMAINASLTGHFVLSTIHTNDASSAPTRLIDMGVQPFLISSSLIAIIAQRLIRTLCPDCKEAVKITDFERAILNVPIPTDATIFKARGCPKCNDTGYTGRTCVCELLNITDEVRSLILRKADSTSIKKVAVKEGMRTLRQDASKKFFAESPQSKTWSVPSMRKKAKKTWRKRPRNKGSSCLSIPTRALTRMEKISRPTSLQKASTRPKQRIRGMGVMLVDIQEQKADTLKKQSAITFGNLISSADLALMTRQLATLIKAKFKL